MDSKIASFYILVFFSAIFIICHAHSSNTTSSPQNFLRGLNGTRKGDHANGLIELKKFLAYLGYINYDIPSNSIHMNDDFFDDMLESGVKDYQSFFRLEVTGILDQETVNLMLKPRCGNQDNHFIGNNDVKDGSSSGHGNVNLSISIRYRLVRPWPADKRHLTFSYPIGIAVDEKAQVATALMKWSLISPFTFDVTSHNDADVKMGFKWWDHGDGHPFDGMGGILAHAFYPPDGRLHFDADETWDTEYRPGTLDIFNVALHEIGHILGLGHSHDPNAAMYPYLVYGQPRKSFTQDDMDGIKALYPNN